MFWWRLVGWPRHTHSSVSLSVSSFLSLDLSLYSIPFCFVLSILLSSLRQFCCPAWDFTFGVCFGAASRQVSERGAAGQRSLFWVDEEQSIITSTACGVFSFDWHYIHSDVVVVIVCQALVLVVAPFPSPVFFWLFWIGQLLLLLGGCYMLLSCVAKLYF